MAFPTEGFLIFGSNPSDMNSKDLTTLHPATCHYGAVYKMAARPLQHEFGDVWVSTTSESDVIITFWLNMAWP